MACSLLNTEVSIDESSPSQPQNQFDCSSLDIHFGIKLDRGLNGIRSHLEQLRDVMISEGAL
jgi:hypothetical protein